MTNSATLSFYVIMPFASDKESGLKIKIIQEIANEHKFSVILPKYKRDIPVFDLRSTIYTMQKATFVLADLSLERPSCYYELGIAETLEIPVFIVAKKGTDIHQTSNRASVRFYEDYEQLRQLLNSIISGVTK